MWLRHFLGWLRSAFCAREDLILENLALRQQLLALHSQRPCRRLTAWHKLFWVVLRSLWTRWKEPLILVTPRSVVNWPYGKETHLRFRGRGVSSTEGSCRFPLVVLQQTTQSFLGTPNYSVIPAHPSIWQWEEEPVLLALVIDAPRGNGPRIAAGLGAAASPQTR